ncbi:hypothetical protein AB5I41_30920 [Sphingomonas sp. MMS24-JH45]
MALEDGQALKPIGNEKFDQTFRDTVSQDDYEAVVGGLIEVLFGHVGLAGNARTYMGIQLGS